VLPEAVVIVAGYLVKQKTRVSVEFGSFQDCHLETVLAQEAMDGT
jgi:hypothetical protein